MKLVTIIIPTLNNIEMVCRCVKSISVNTVGLFRFIIVNQGNKDLENFIVFDKWENAGFRESKMLHVDKPLGWAGAINYGFHHMHPALESPKYEMNSAISKSLTKSQKEGISRFMGDYVLMMNDDTLILPGNFGWLTDLTNVLEYDNEVGAVGPASNFVAGKQNVFDVANPIFLETKFLIGFCMLVRRDLFDTLGGLDESLPGGDDLDLSIRIRDAGYKLIARRNTFVFHIGQVTGRQHYGDYWDCEQHQTETKLALIRKHGFKKTHYTYLNECFPYERLAAEYGEENIFRGIVKGEGLDIGCGQNKEPEALGIDLEVDGNKTDANIKCPGDDLYMVDDESKDYIISRHLIEHFFNPLKALREWYRVLKQGGRVGISTPDGRRWQSIDCDGDHKHQYDRETLKELMEIVGFKIIELEGCRNQLDFYIIAEK